MIPAIAQRALSAVGWSENAIEFAFMDDRDDHVSTLLPGAAFSVGLPWRQPDCGQPGFLTERDFALCEFYAFSEPLFGTVSGVYGAKGSLPGAEFGFTGLMGARLCVADETEERALAERGVAAPQVEVISEATLAACFQRLLAGQVDYVSGEAFEAETAIAEVGGGDLVAEAEWLAMATTLHAVAPRDDAAAVAVLADIDAGLMSMRENGEWFAVVARYLALR